MTVSPAVVVVMSRSDAGSRYGFVAPISLKHRPVPWGRVSQLRRLVILPLSLPLHLCPPYPLKLPARVHGIEWSHLFLVPLLLGLRPYDDWLCAQETAGCCRRVFARLTVRQVRTRARTLSD